MLGITNSVMIDGPRNAVVHAIHLRGYNVTGATIGGRDYSLKCKGGAQGQPPFFGHADSVAPFIVIIMGLQVIADRETIS